MLDTLGYYAILDRIAAGGLGEVYRARDTRVGRTVIIRLLPDEVTHDPARREVVLEAARRAARISHPNVAALFEIGEDGSRLFLVFEHVSGEGLQVVIADRPLKVGRALEFAVQLADALAEGHAQGIVHGDIRPDKILLTKTGHAKLLDFGVAGFSSGGKSRIEFAESLAAGSALPRAPVEYMAPEQVLGAAGDARTDVFCLGAVLFEMLTGRPPFKGSTAEDTAMEILRAAAPVASQTNPQVPPAVDRVLARALSKSLDARQQSAAELAADLRAAAEPLVAQATDKAPVGEAASGAGTNWRPWLAVLAVALLGLAAWMYSDVLGRAWRRWLVAPPSPVLAVVAGDAAATNAPRPYFANGFLADLADRFGHTPGFTVVSRSAVGQGGDSVQAARAAGATVVLSSTLETSAGDVTVDAALRDTTKGDVLWSGRVTKPRGDVLALHSELVDRIAERLEVPVDATPERVRAASRAVDPEGYDLYLQGRDALRLGDMPRAASLFRRAAIADPSLAEAHAAYVVAEFSNALSTGVMERELMRRAAASAMAIDADLAAAQLASGLTAEDVPRAVQHLRRALDIDPSSPATLVAIGNEIVGLDPARALDFYGAAAKLDPQLLPAHLGVARVRALLGQKEAAARELANVVDVSGDDVRVKALAFLLGAEGDSAATQLPDGWMPPPAHALKLAMVLAGGRPDVAAPLARQAARAAPRYCDAQALAAAFDVDGLLTAKPAPASASQATDTLCAALGAAVQSDGRGTADLLRKIAGAPALFRPWIRPVGGVSLSETLRSGRYPWANVAADDFVAGAVKELDQSFARARAEVSELLRGLPRE